MTVVTALIIFIVGSIVGFFANYFLSSSNQKQRELAEKVNKRDAELAQYKLDVAEHLASSANLLEQMNTTCQSAMKQMQESTQLLQQASTLDADGMPFFSQETQQQLAQTAALRRQKRSSENTNMTTEPPLDYSGQASGLFVGEKPNTKIVD